jgi:DNA-binding NtrC family response regulator
MAKVLIVDDEVRIRATFAEFLEDCGHSVVTAEDGNEAKKHLITEIVSNNLIPAEPIEIVLCDMIMPNCNGSELFQWMQENKLSHIPFVCISGKSDSQDVMNITTQGAFDFLSKPLHDLRELQAVVERAVNTSQRQGLISLATQQPETLRPTLPIPSLVGRSPKFLKIAQMIARVAAMDTTVLITGESGTGKEVVARSLHEASPRKDGPFVAVNCAAIPPSLIESELFGHEKGAFTGAISSKTGRFTQANKGTLFLDEIGELDISLQSKLLRVIQERAVEPVGCRKSHQVDVRIITATNRNLEAMVNNNLFRSDLLFRLQVYPIHLPPLRERKEDILPLSRHLASKIADRLKMQPPSLTKDAFQKLLQYSWPGNIRELENTIERAMIERRHGGIILPEDIRISQVPALHEETPSPTPPHAQSETENDSTSPRTSSSTQNPSTDSQQINENEFVIRIPTDELSWNAIELKALNQVLLLTQGNISKAAQILHLSRSHLRSRLRLHGIGK